MKAYFYRPENHELQDVAAEKLEEVWQLVLTPSATGMLWVDFQDTTEEEFDLLYKVFKFHPLCIEDCIVPQERPKIDIFSEYIFIIIHSMFYYKEEDQPPDAKNGLSYRELDIFLGKNYLVTLHNSRVRAVSAMHEKLKSAVTVLERGPEYLLYSIFNRLIENYFLTLDKLEDNIDEVEDKIFLGKYDNKILQDIFTLKKNVIYLRKFLSPQRELVSSLLWKDINFISQNMNIYFRDISDNLVRVHELVDSYRDMLNSLMEAYLTVISTRLNDIMKTLTIIATFMMPATLVASFYGMNVEIPEFKWGIYGYLFVWVILILSTLLTVVYFKKKRLF